MELITQTEFARRVKVSRQRIGQLLQAGRLPVGPPDRWGRTQIPWAEAKAVWDADKGMEAKVPAEALTEAEQEPEITPAQPLRPARMLDAASIAMEHARARAADKVAQAKTRQLRYEQLKGTLVERSLVELDAANTALTVRSALQALPAKVSPRLEGLPAAEIEALLEAEIDQALQALHESRGAQSL